MVLCGTNNGSSTASLEEPFEAPLLLRVQSSVPRDPLESILKSNMHNIKSVFWMRIIFIRQVCANTQGICCGF